MNMDDIPSILHPLSKRGRRSKTLKRSIENRHRWWPWEGEITGQVIGHGDGTHGAFFGCLWVAQHMPLYGHGAQFIEVISRAHDLVKTMSNLVVKSYHFKYLRDTLPAFFKFYNHMNITWRALRQDEWKWAGRCASGATLVLTRLQSSSAPFVLTTNAMRLIGRGGFHSMCLIPTTTALVPT